MKPYFLTVFCAIVVFGIVMFILPSNGIGKSVKTASGLLILCLIIHPLNNGQSPEFSFENNYVQELPDIETEMENICKSIAETEIRNTADGICSDDYDVSVVVCSSDGEVVLTDIKLIISENDMRYAGILSSAIAEITGIVPMIGSRGVQ